MRRARPAPFPKEKSSIASCRRAKCRPGERRDFVLVPKLRLGTQVAKLRFAAPTVGCVSCPSGKQSFPTCVPKRSLGTRKTGHMAIP